MAQVKGHIPKVEMPATVAVAMRCQQNDAPHGIAALHSFNVIMRQQNLRSKLQRCKMPSIVGMKHLFTNVHPIQLATRLLIDNNILNLSIIIESV